MKAKVLLRLVDRTERTYEVEADKQQDFLVQAAIKLETELKYADKLTASVWDLIESWQTFPEIANTPGIDKTDGIAVRSPKQKIRFDLIPTAAMVEVAKVFTFGAYHYGDRNWEAGFSWSRCIGSALRHFYKFTLGEDYDDESGLHHLAHFVANGLFLLEYAIRKTGTDDRVIMPANEVQKLFTPLTFEDKEKC